MRELWVLIEEEIPENHISYDDKETAEAVKEMMAKSGIEARVVRYIPAE